MNEILFLNTVDCDLRVSSVVTRDEALAALVDAFGECGVAGHATWFLNENDFALTHCHERFLAEVIDRGDAIGIHDHIDFLGDRRSYHTVRDFCSRSLVSVRTWLAEQGHSLPLSAHRFGCAFQRPEAYQVLIDLGYSISSDVVPETIHHNHTGELSFDNRDVPEGVLPYRHAAEAITDYDGDEGPMLQIPFLRATLTAGFWPRLDHHIVDRWLSGAEKLGHKMAVIAFCFHPYEIVDQRRLRIDRGGVSRLEQVQRMMREDYGAAFASVEEIAERF